ncbi:MAG: hypothetical protein P0S94_02170 [Simkaniaceae bacterium]|nr:hypothetical protein [Simkaniaceae bacterium]
MSLAIEDIPRNPDDALKFLIQYWYANLPAWKDGVNEDAIQYIHFLKVAVANSSFDEGYKAKFADTFEYLLPTDFGIADLQELVSRIKLAMSELALKEHFSNPSPDLLGSEIELDSQSRKKIAGMLRDVRSAIWELPDIDEAKRNGLLKLLDRLEQELAFEKSSYARIRIYIEEMGDTLGRFGQKAKPITKPIIEILSEVRKIVTAHSSYHQELEAPEEQLQIEGPNSEKK